MHEYSCWGVWLSSTFQIQAPIEGNKLPSVRWDSSKKGKTNTESEEAERKIFQRRLSSRAERAGSWTHHEGPAHKSETLRGFSMPSKDTLKAPQSHFYFSDWRWEKSISSYLHGGPLRPPHRQRCPCWWYRWQGWPHELDPGYKMKNKHIFTQSLSCEGETGEKLTKWEGKCKLKQRRMLHQHSRLHTLFQ